MTAPRKKSKAKAAPASSRTHASGLLAGYSKTRKPLGGYLALVGAFHAGLAGAFAASAGKDDELPKLSWSDLLLFGIATHKLSRIMAKDIVTSPLRAPFVKFKKYSGEGEVEEEARGEGLQEAIGDLISCPYCMAPWIASVLVFASARAPRAARLTSAVFAVAAGSDFLNRFYARTKE